MGNSSDCDDGNAATNPTSYEICDGLDNNCTGGVDEGALDADDWYVDVDGDGFGAIGTPVSSCDQPLGYADNDDDCDDDPATGPSVHPNASEICNSIDDDCDGTADDGAVDATIWYVDADGDSYGNPATGSLSCTQIGGTVQDATDCNDTEAAVNPAATDFCGDGIDNDCDGQEAVPSTDIGQPHCPGESCQDIFDTLSVVPDGAYTIDGDGAGGVEPFSVYCDMTTVGGGWTLIAKLDGQSSTGNRLDTGFWRDRNYIGNITSLSGENALGSSYETVAFSDVMVRSLTSPARHIAWRHPSNYTSVYDVVDAGNRISDGALLSGSVQNLDYNNSASYHNDCPNIQYGFFGHDYHYNHSNGIAGHTSLHHGHAGGVVSASKFSDIHANSSGQNNAITDWAFGGGYVDMSSSQDQRNIQAHWWGAGNTYTADFNSHGLFVR